MSPILTRATSESLAFLGEGPREIGLAILSAPVTAIIVWVARGRKELLDGDIAEAFFQAVLQQARERSPLSDEHFTVDGTLLEAWASVKSYHFRRNSSSCLDSLNPQGGRGCC